MPHFDLTHTFTPNMPVYPGDPSPQLKQCAFLAKDGFNDFQISTGMHVGTHMDGPLHMLANGQPLYALPPERFFGKGRLIDARNQQTINATLLHDKQILKGDIILVMTGFYKKFGTPEYYKSYPEISEEFAQKMVDLGVSIVGIDTPSLDRAPFAIHKLLLSHEILIIENLTNLEHLLEAKNVNITALPAKFQTESAPVRVVANLLDQ